MRVVGIHGMNQTYRGGPQLKPEWLAAINAGLEEVKHPPLTDADFDMVGYGPVFRPEGTRGGDQPLAIEDVDEDKLAVDEKELLLRWWLEAARLAASAPLPGNNPERDEEPTIQGDEKGTRVSVPGFVQRALTQLAKSRFFTTKNAQNLLVFDLRQVRDFLHDPVMKAKILARVDEVVTADTRVVVAHSLGTIVAYEALCRDNGWKVDTLITLGAPLGIPKMIFDVLTPPPVNKKGVRPKVRRWVNVADKGDIVALVKELAPLFDGVEDVPVHNGWKSHDGSRYLNSKEVGRVIADALAGG